MVKENYRQGDVEILPLKSSPIPKKAVRVDSKILAQGEVTGHHHGFSQDAAVVCYKDGSDMFIDVQDESVLFHQEHNVFPIPLGTYKVLIARELDEMAEAHRVSD